MPSRRVKFTVHSLLTMGLLGIAYRLIPQQPVHFPFDKEIIDIHTHVAGIGAVLIKWIPAIMDIDPSDKALRPYYRKLVELDLPLLIHVGQERSFGPARDELGDPVKLNLPLDMGVTVVAAHIATTGKNQREPNFDRILPMFRRYPNLYTEISSLTQVNKRSYPPAPEKGRLFRVPPTQKL